MSDERPGAASSDVGTTDMNESAMGAAPGGSGGSSTMRPGAPVRRSGPPPGSTRGSTPGGGPSDAPAIPTATDPMDFVTDYAAYPDPLEDKRAERRVAALFVISALATCGFIACYTVLKIHTDTYGAALSYSLAATLALALITLGFGLVLWAKSLIPKEYAVQDRHDGGSPPADRKALEDDFLAGADRLGIGRRPLLRRTMLLAAGIIPLPALVLLRDLGPAPEKTLRRTAWRRGTRLVDAETRQPLKLGDIRVGGIATVMPEGFEKLSEEETATSPTILIRMRPQDLSAPTQLNWTLDGHVAYSKVCTHAGCPTSLYEQQTKHLLCPCHQSTFQADQGCRVVFGPAARPLPQLPIEVDDEGYFVASSDYREPVGPSFWERG